MEDLLIDDPVFGYRVRLSREGDVLRGEFAVEPGGGGLIEHLHPPVEERFEVIEGQIAYTLGRRKGSAGAGDRFTVPAGAPHTFRNSGSQTAHVVVEMEPALRMADMFREAAALGAAGKWTRIGKRGVPKTPAAVVDMCDFLDRYGDIFVPTSPPRIVQRVGVPPLARLARRRRRARRG